jgi:DNA (cytosine-5)-methyltransferase 1
MAARQLVSLELCAGAGGQALGLEHAGFDHAAAVEIDADCCRTLRKNRPGWQVLNMDVRDLNGRNFRGIDLLAAGVPCPPFSIAGKQLGSDDERDLFPTALRLIEESKPKAVLIENVRGLSNARFASYRKQVIERLRSLGYVPDWQVLNASDFGVAQLRPRFLLVAIAEKYASGFMWPTTGAPPPTVGSILHDLMSARGWPGADEWAQKANSIGPTLVGGSKKHGGPDLGPTRAKRAWAELGVDGHGVADLPPGLDFPIHNRPKLTVRMTARLQGFVDEWEFVGRKTAAYRQVGNAFPPPVACAVASSIKQALKKRRSAAVRAVREPTLFPQAS